jgi:hypothetical protein
METPKTTIRIPPDERSAFQSVADKEKLPLAVWMRRVCREAVRRHNRRKD